MSVRSIRQTAFYIQAAAMVEQKKLEVHRNHNGIFVRAKDSQKYHSVVLTDYSLGRKGSDSLLPRLKVNTPWAIEPIPARLRKSWAILNGAKGICRIVNVEITFLREEATLITPFLPDLLERIEAGKLENLENVFPIPFSNTTKTNLWTTAARDHAHRYAVATGAYNRPFAKLTGAN